MKGTAGVYQAGGGGQGARAEAPGEQGWVGHVPHVPRLREQVASGAGRVGLGKGPQTPLGGALGPERSAGARVGMEGARQAAGRLPWPLHGFQCAFLTF